MHTQKKRNKKWLYNKNQQYLCFDTFNTNSAAFLQYFYEHCNRKFATRFPLKYEMWQQIVAVITTWRCFMHRFISSYLYNMLLVCIYVPMAICLFVKCHKKCLCCKVNCKCFNLHTAGVVFRLYFGSWRGNWLKYDCCTIALQKNMYIYIYIYYYYLLIVINIWVSVYVLQNNSCHSSRESLADCT